MKKVFLFLALAVFALVAVCSGADPVAPVVAAVPAVTVASVGFLDWFKQNSTAVIAAALVLSELLSLVPAFEGNGILDTIIKALRAMSNKAV